MRDLRENLIDILKAEVKPAVGCTEPVAVALACAKAKELLGEDVVKNKILVSPNVYKNAMCVGIPGIERLGLKIAVAMGLVGGKSEDGLTLLEGLTDEQVKKSEEYMDATPISIEPLDTKEKVVIDVTLEGENNKSRVILIGIASYFMLHLFVNLGGVSGLIPMTGVPLLLVSSGGSSTIAALIAIGIAQAIISKFNKEQLEKTDT